MKQDWLKDIHDRMADFEVEAPQGLWEDICKAEVGVSSEVAKTSSRKSYWMWPVGIAVAAACLLLVWFIRPDLVQDSGSTSSILEQEIVAIDSTKTNLPEIDNSIAQIAKNNRIEVPYSETDTKDSTIYEKKDSVINVIPKERIFEQKEIEKESQPKRYEYLARADRKRDEEHRLTMGLSASGGIGSDDRQRFTGGYLAASALSDETDWVDSPLLGIMALNRGTETEKKVTHHSPFRIGLSFSYKLNARWSLESGITYALVSSDKREGSNANYIDENQKLHYVGIPIGVSYRLFTWKRLNVYASSDLLAEQCVYGKSTKRYIIGEHIQGEEIVETLKSRPLQVSLGAKVGAQYSLNSLFSVYVEPGCRYYFDDRSSLETVFKEKPFDFNLNLGLRFTFNN